MRTQNSNRSSCVRVELDGRLVTMQEAAELSGVPLKTLYGRAQSGKVGADLFRKRFQANA